MPTIYEFQPTAWIRVTGEDAPTFLQSQFSNELQQTGPNPVVYGLWLTRKGKTCADSFIFRRAEKEFLVFSYFCPAATIIDKMEANLIADEVELENLTSTVTGISWWGDEAKSFLNHLGLNEPLAGSFIEADGKYLMRGRRSESVNYDLIVPKDQTEALISQFDASDTTAKVIRASDDELHWERLKSRIPAIPHDIGPDDLPQEGELEDDAISFDKGCFLGQEVMARLHSMGRVQRKIFPVYSEGPLISTLPCDLFDQKNIVGQLRSAASDGKSWIGHALLKDRSRDTSGLSLIANDAPRVYIDRSRRSKVQSKKSVDFLC